MISHTNSIHFVFLFFVMLFPKILDTLPLDMTHVQELNGADDQHHAS
jgi:hypothetical protein